MIIVNFTANHTCCVEHSAGRRICISRVFAIASNAALDCDMARTVSNFAAAAVAVVTEGASLFAQQNNSHTVNTTTLAESDRDRRRRADRRTPRNWQMTPCSVVVAGGAAANHNIMCTQEKNG